MSSFKKKRQKITKSKINMYLSPRMSKKLIYGLYWQSLQYPWAVQEPRRFSVALLYGEDSPASVQPGHSWHLHCPSLVPRGQAALLLLDQPGAQESCPALKVLSGAWSAWVHFYPLQRKCREKKHNVISQNIILPHLQGGDICISPISPFLRDVDRTGWGEVCEGTFSTIQYWAVEGPQLWGRCHVGAWHGPSLGCSRWHRICFLGLNIK